MNGVQIADSVVWITGATGGFGRELAHMCARNGVPLALTSRSRSALELLAADCKGAGSPDVLIECFDVRDESAVARAAETIHRTFGRVGGFVASAADVPLGDLESLSADDWTYGIQNKLLGTVHCLRAVLPIMREQRNGRVVVLSGMRGTEPLPGSLLPGAVNAALNNIVKGLSRDFARCGVAINAVSPTLVMTPRGELYVEKEAAKNGRSIDEIKHDWTKDSPSGRFVSASEVVTTIFALLFVLPESFTGQTVIIDGSESRGVR